MRQETIVILLLAVCVCRGRSYYLDRPILSVPAIALGNGDVTLTCSYNTRDLALYSAKWYFEDQEFYRFDPHESPTEHIFEIRSFKIKESFSNVTYSSVTLTQLSSSASGQYRCEVTTEAPMFASAISVSTMNIVYTVVGLSVPSSVNEGGEASLTCSYDNAEKDSKSVRLYHEGAEFYTYFPQNFSTIVSPTRAFNVQEDFANATHLSFTLTHLSLTAAGKYTCEVITDVPKLDTVFTSNAAVMNVILKAPNLSLSVPPRPFEGGGDVNVVCSFDATTDKGVYVITLYHNGIQFYTRWYYNQDILNSTISSLKCTNVKDVFNNETHVVVTLTNLVQCSSGQYKCSMLTGPPYFHTFSTDDMTMEVLTYAETAPQPPKLKMSNSLSTNHINVIIEKGNNPNNIVALQGFSLHYRPRSLGDWQIINVSSSESVHSISDLACGSVYEIYATAYNSLTVSQPSPVLEMRTEGTKPRLPDEPQFVERFPSIIQINLSEMEHYMCPISVLTIEYKNRNEEMWTLVTENADHFVNRSIQILNLSETSNYDIQITTLNDAGSTVAHFECGSIDETATPSGDSVNCLPTGCQIGDEFHPHRSWWESTCHLYTCRHGNAQVIGISSTCCKFNNVIYSDGEEWTTSCRTQICLSGSIYTTAFDIKCCIVEEGEKVYPEESVWREEDRYLTCKGGIVSTLDIPNCSS